MFEYRHAAYNVTTGEILNSVSGNALKRAVAANERYNRTYYNCKGEWRWSHDFGKRWDIYSSPAR